MLCWKGLRFLKVVGEIPEHRIRLYRRGIQIMRRLGVKPHKIMVDVYAASPSLLEPPAHVSDRSLSPSAIDETLHTLHRRVQPDSLSPETPNSDLGCGSFNDVKPGLGSFSF